MGAFFPQFSNAIKGNNALQRWAKSNLYSNYVPGLRNMNNTFSAMLNEPFTNVPGGGVEDVQARNQMTQGQYLPSMTPLVESAAQNKNYFADLLQGAKSSDWNILQMIDQLNNMQHEMSQQATSGLAGAFGL